MSLSLVEHTEGLKVCVRAFRAGYLSDLQSPPRSLHTPSSNTSQVASDWEHPCQVPSPDGSGVMVDSVCKNNWWPEGLPRNASIGDWLGRQLTDRHYVRTHVDNYQVRVVCWMGWKGKRSASGAAFGCVGKESGSASGDACRCRVRGGSAEG